MDKLSVSWLWIIPAAPLLSAMLVGIFATRFVSRPLPRLLAHVLAIGSVGLACALSLWTLCLTLKGQKLDEALYTWMQVGSVRLEIGFLVDNLTALMMCVVSLVSLLVHIYSVGYMAEDESDSRFFCYLSLFTFAMLMLVMGNNFLQLFFGWEAVGLVSYLLIGFWFEKPRSASAGLKAFLVNRVGDFGFILGIGLVLAFAGSLQYQEVFALRENLAQTFLPGTGWLVVTVICICLFIGAMGKSAQFPLHVWLPDSMEGPTPISALIHAATMVTAGIFMVARMSPLFELSTTALSLMLVVGSITALFMGMVGMVQDDIKRVIAFSTLSQLGYMVAGLGASAYAVSIFYLMVHAFFKALLFLAAGSVILAMHHLQDIRYMGGLRRHLPISWITMLIGALALAGIPFLSGFYGKESIVMAVSASSIAGSAFAKIALHIGVFITAFYSFRMVFLVFYGQERFREEILPETGEHVGLHPGDKPHESPAVMTIPLIILALFSLGIGFVTVAPVMVGSFFEGVITVDTQAHPAMRVLAESFQSAWAMGLHGWLTLPVWLALAGIATAWYCYLKNPAMAVRCRRQWQTLHSLLQHGWYLDAFNEQVFIKGARALGRGLWRGGDVRVIDGVLVNGSVKVVRAIAHVFRYLQSGWLYQYVLVMVLGLVMLLLLYMPLYLVR